MIAEEDKPSTHPVRGRMQKLLDRALTKLAGARALVLARVQRFIPDEPQHLLAVTVLVGLVCGLVAVAFHLAIQIAEAQLVGRAVGLGGLTGTALLIISPALGGLLGGILLARVVPGARGSGIPQVKQVYALGDGKVPFRDAVGKFIIGTLQIGSGASLGREGPTVQICAGASTLIGRVTALPARNMRRLLPVAAAAGIAAAFNAPMAAVTFTIEEVVGTLDHTILSGVVVAAALSAVIERAILGANPVINAPHGLELDHASSLLIYALLGVAAAGVSIVFTDGFLGVRAWFRKLRAVPLWAQPAVGGLATGLLAAIVLLSFGVGGVAGGGYETVGLALEGRLALGTLIALCGAKLAATVLSYSSGGAGGIFMPALFVGAMLGGVVGHIDVSLLGHEPRQMQAFALVGMGAVFAGVIRAPITSVLIIFEMTGAYGLILPLMVANVTCFVLAKRSRPTPIYEALLEQDGIYLPRAAPPRLDLGVTLEAVVRAHDLARTLVLADPSLPVSDAIGLAGAREVGILVAAGHGIRRVILGDQLVALAKDAGTTLVGELANTLPEIGPEATLPEILSKIADDSVDALLVSGPTGSVVGVVTRSDVAFALLELHALEGPTGVAPRKSSDR